MLEESDDGLSEFDKLMSKCEDGEKKTNVQILFTSTTKTMEVLKDLTSGLCERRGGDWLMKIFLN